MSLNYWAIILSAILSMVLGFVWYGPLFGRLWMRINHVTEMDKQRRAEMQRRAMPLYIAQFFITLFQVYIVAHIVRTLPPGIPGVIACLLVVVAFVLPTLAASCMWTNEKRKIAWTRFLIQGGYQLVLFIIFGLVLGLWR